MKLVLSLIFLLSSFSSFAHYRHYGCDDSIVCLDSISKCFPSADREYSVIYHVEKKKVCPNGHRHDDESSFTVQESFSTTAGRGVCESHKAAISNTYRHCN